MESAAIAIVALVHAAAATFSQLARICEEYQNAQKSYRSMEDSLYAFTKQLEGIKEKQTWIQNDGCTQRHSEVESFLRQAGRAAEELERIVCDTKPGGLRVGSQQERARWPNGHALLEWMLPAAEMLEGAFDRLWLHVHIVRVNRTAENSSPSSTSDTDESMAIDREGFERLSDWVDLRYVPVVKRTSRQRLGDIFDDLKLPNDTYALVVERGCIGLESRDAYTGPTEAKLGTSVRSGIWGLNLSSPGKMRSQSIRPGSPNTCPAHSRDLFEVASTKDQERLLALDEGNKEKVWLCFSDLLQPADIRPMFGHILRMYPASTQLHRAHIEALSRIDTILELPQAKRARSKTPGLGSLGTIQEMIDCSTWHLDQSSIWRDTGSFSSLTDPFSLDDEIHLSHYKNDWDAFWAQQYPDNGLHRHFAVRAAYCVFASFRPLTKAELFAATTTKIQPEDHDWPDTLEGSTSRAELLLNLCSAFLTTTENGQVKIKSPNLALCFSQNESNAAVQAYVFLAWVCLSQLIELDLRIVIWPWSRYNELRKHAELHPLHVYVVNFWQLHYRQAEPNAHGLPNLLHKVIEEAWLAERTQVSTDSDGDEVDLDAYDEALDVGLILCQAYGFKELQSAYLNMGARTHASPVISPVSTNDKKSPAQSDMTEQTGPGTKSTSESFDFSDWFHVEPFNPP